MQESAVWAAFRVFDKNGDPVPKKKGPFNSDVCATGTGYSSREAIKNSMMNQLKPHSFNTVLTVLGLILSFFD